MWIFGTFGLFIIIMAIILLFYFVPFGLWISALASGSYVGIFTLIGMRLRRVPPRKIVEPLIKSRKAGLKLTVNDLETHFLAGGHVNNVIDALIAANKAHINLTYDGATAIDLAGRDVLDAVKTSVNPKVIETGNISAVAKDGIEVLVRARVTVRTNLDRLVGGAGEATVIARVGEGIVTTVGSSENHGMVLENPDSISRAIISKGLDENTAYEILSIDIADVDVGRNIGAHLKTLQAEADKQIAQAEAEKRRALAVATEQENKAAVVLAEAEIPKAMAEAFRNGNLGIMDYYNMQNLQADTDMRKSFAEPVYTQVGD